MLAKVFRALREESTGSAMISTDLAIPTDELSKSVFGYMLRLIDGGAQRSPAAPPQDRPALRVV